MDEATLKAAEFTEKQFNNGKIIDWGYWAGLKNITTEQAAKLANRIDPITTKDSCIDLKAIPDDLHGTLQQAIDRLNQQLANKNASWTLVELADFLGDDAPHNMKCAVEMVKVKPQRKPKNEQRDASFKQWLEIDGNKARVEILTKEELQRELQEDSRLWSHGFGDWVKYTTLYEGKAGRPKNR